MAIFSPGGALDLVRAGEHVHGHLGWLAVAALAHPAVLLRNPSRRAHLSVGVAVALASVAGALGAVLYPSYRVRLRGAIFTELPAVGYLFERKEHLAFGALVLAWAGAVAYAGAHLRSADVDLYDPLRRAAHWAFIAAAVLGLTVAILGTVVASYRTF
jgi:hypothetical protein